MILQKVFADVFKVTDSKIGRLSRWVQSNHMNSFFQVRAGKLRQKGGQRGKKHKTHKSSIEEKGNEPGYEEDF